MTTSEATKRRAGIFTVLTGGIVLLIGLGLLLLPDHHAGAAMDPNTLAFVWFLRGAAAMAGGLQAVGWLLVLLMPDEPDPPKTRRAVPGPSVLAATETRTP